jgi:hypothetical protein
MCDRLDIDGHHRRLIRLAALLHDIGHGPFSHTSESVLSELVSDEVRAKAGGTEKIHELITRRIILTDPDLGRILSEKDRLDVVALLDQGLDQPLYKSVISGPLDADKQDYLLRDSYFCGVRYGVFDIERLGSVLGREKDDSGDILVVDDDGIHTLEQFVLARYFLTTQVIRHKGRLISDSMLVRGLKLGVMVDGIDFLRSLYSFEETDAFCQHYLSWNDERLMSRLLEPEHSERWAGRMARRLHERRLYKRIFSENLDQLSPSAGLLGAPLKASFPAIESEVAAILSEFGETRVDPHEVILDITKAPPPKKSEGSVLLRRPGSPLQAFEERSAIFGSIDKTLRAESLECYAPVALSDESKRQQLEGRVAELIIKKVEELRSSAPVAEGSQSERVNHAD